MAAKPKPRKPATPATPTVRFAFKPKTWLAVKWACHNDDLFLVAKSITEYVKSAQGDGLIEIDIPLDLQPKIARACANHDVSVGIAFTVAAA